jgi:hypothetical protein
MIAKVTWKGLNFRLLNNVFSGFLDADLTPSFMLLFLSLFLFISVFQSTLSPKDRIYPSPGPTHLPQHYVTIYLFM